MSRFVINCVFGKMHLLLGLLLLIMSPAIIASAANITIIANPQDDSHAELIESMKAALARYSDNGFNINIVPLASLDNNNVRERDFLDTDLVVTLGTTAAQQVGQLNIPAISKTPLLHALIPKINFDGVTQQRRSEANPVRDLSAIYLDQPLPRQINLLRLALPQCKRLGVVLGTASQTLLPDMENAAEKEGLRIYSRIAKNDSSLIATLNDVLAESDMILAIPDPLIFNRYTVQNLLLTTYRQKIPVIGFSQAYVRAGALMAVYSTPAQIGQQVAEVLRLAATRNWKLPAPQYPRYYTITINRQVARSLELRLPNENELQLRLQQTDKPSL
ncbi:MAG: hypothetical protein M3A44_07470 [Gammaproteobacteria bacterium]